MNTYLFFISGFLVIDFRDFLPQMDFALYFSEPVIENLGVSSSSSVAGLQLESNNNPIPESSGANGYTTHHNFPRSHTFNFREGDGRCYETTARLKKSVSVNNTMSKCCKNETGRRLSESLSGHFSFLNTNAFSIGEK